MCRRHGWAIVRGLPPFGETRCWYCGHRLPVSGKLPRQTREFPIRYWAAELISRFRARYSTPTLLTFDEYDERMLGVKRQITR